MPDNTSVKDLVIAEVSSFAKVPASFIKTSHKLGSDLRLVKPALVHLAASLRAHIRHRNPGATLSVTEIEKSDFTVQQLIDLVIERVGADAMALNTSLMTTLAILLVCILAWPAAAAAQSGLLSGFTIRKAFNGGRDEQQPASLGYVFRNSESGDDFALIDVGIKHRGRQLNTVDDGFGPEFILYPSVEWHRGEAEPLRGVASQFNKLSAAANLEIYFGDATGHKRQKPVLAPWMFVKADVARNYIKDSDEVAISALASVYSIKNWLPGADTAIGAGQHQRRLLKYVPYVGVERFENLAVEAGGKIVVPDYTGTQTVARLYVELFPLMAAVPGQNRIVITGEFNRRWRLAGDVLDGSIASASLSGDFYFDDDQKVAIGITHDRGEFPKANFVRQRRTYISFRVKI